jgi:hypothetical protein
VFDTCAHEGNEITSFDNKLYFRFIICSPNSFRPIRILNENIYYMAGPKGYEKVPQVDYIELKEYYAFINKKGIIINIGYVIKKETIYGNIYIYTSDTREVIDEYVDSEIPGGVSIESGRGTQLSLQPKLNMYVVRNQYFADGDDEPKIIGVVAVTPDLDGKLYRRTEGHVGGKRKNRRRTKKAHRNRRRSFRRN